MRANEHLTEDDLDDVLLGVGSVEATAHLKACAVCAARTAEFGAAVASFNQATLAWSEAKANTLSRDLGASDPAPTSRFVLVGTALCGFAVLGALFGNYRPMRDESVAVTSTQIATADRDREIDGDNAMLREIDAALYRPEPSPEQTYEMTALSAGSARRSSVPGVRE